MAISGPSRPQKWIQLEILRRIALTRGLAKQNQVISFEPKNSNEEFDPKGNRFECMSCGFIYDPDEGIKKLNIEQELHS